MRDVGEGRFEEPAGQASVPGLGMRLAAAAEASLNAVLVLEPLRAASGTVSDFAFVDLNERAAKLIGRPREEVVGQAVGTLYPEYRTLGLFDRYVGVVERGEPTEIEVRSVKGFEPEWLNVQVVPVADGIAVSIQDVTERKQAERRLAGQHAVAQVLAAAIELEAALPRLLEQVCVTLGWQSAAYWRAERDGTYRRLGAWPRAVGPDERRLEGVEEAWERGRLLWGRSKLFLPVREAGRVAGTLELVPAVDQVEPDLVGTTAGIADQLGAFLDRRRADLEAERTHALLGAALESTTDGLLVVDSGRRVVAVNERFRELWGISEELIQRADEEELLLGVLDRLEQPEAFLARVLELYADPEAESLELLRFRDGRLIERYTRPRRLGDVTVGRVWSFRDVTERERLEQALEEAKRLEAIRQLAGGIAHDFNNLLTVILGSTELALARMDPEGSPARLIREARRAAERSAGLTRALLSFGRRQILEPRLVDVNAELTALEPELRTLCGPEVELSLQLGQDVGPVRFDPFQLVEALRQIVGNACEALPEGGRITVATENSGASKVAITVLDTGVGMDEETRSRVFEPFFSTKREAGAGLGLAAVYGVVKQSGGDVLVESEPGRGSTFTLVLPRPEPEEEPAAPAAGTASSAPRAPTVLLVEDEPLVREVTAEALAERGFEVVTAASGHEALELAAGREEPFGLLLTDVIMPGMDGHEVALRLRERWPGLRILFVSGHADSELLSVGSPEGVAFLQKPYAFAELERKLTELLDS